MMIDMNREVGFTIIELLVVIIVIGILTTVGTLGIGGLLVSSRDSQRADDITGIARKLEDDYTSQISGSPSYPSTNTFVSDAASGGKTAAGIDPATFKAPGSANSSVAKATTTDQNSPDGTGSPFLNIYYYQALTRDNLLCQDSSQTCVRFQLFYRRESDNTVVVIASMHQQ